MPGHSVVDMGKVEHASSRHRSYSDRAMNTMSTICAVWILIMVMTIIMLIVVSMAMAIDGIIHLQNILEKVNTVDHYQPGMVGSG